MTTLTPFIPFLTGSVELASLALKLYSDCKLFRVPLRGYGNIRKRLSGRLLWIDTGLDGIDSDRDGKHGKFLAQHSVYELLDDPKSRRAPDKAKVEKVITSLMNAAAEANPFRVSIPQLPLANDGRRNQLNRALAAQAYAWATENGYADKLILPVVATHSNQIKGKTQRTPKISVVKQCVEASCAGTVWFVLANFNEHDATESYPKRIQSIIDFHQEIRNALPSGTSMIGGPYWGLQLVLWSRDLISAAGITVGSGFQYYLPGSPKAPATARIAIPPLLRTARALPETREWLVHAAEVKRAMGEARYVELLELLKSWQVLQTDTGAKKQVAEFYRDWLERLVRTSESGRSLGLYQELSKAYVFGAGLPPLEAERGRAREPACIAELLMLIALA